MTDNVSYVVEDEVLSSSLWTRLRQLDNVDVHHGTAKFTLPSRTRSGHSDASATTDLSVGLDQDAGEFDRDDLVKLALSNGQNIETRLLVRSNFLFARSHVR